jgi:hypothetical protein
MMKATISRDVVTLVLASVIALVTFAVIGVVQLGLFTGMGIIFPMFVAWASASVFALSRQPRHGWLHVAILGVVVASVLTIYMSGLRLLYPPAFGVPPGGPNANPPGLTPIPPP